MIKFSGFLIIIISFAIFFAKCNTYKTQQPVSELGGSCGVAYLTNDMHFKREDTLLFNLRFVYFADSINEEVVKYDSIVNGINNFFKESAIQVYNDTSNNLFVVNTAIKYDMPSFTKYHLMEFQNDSFLTIYIYGTTQPNYINDSRNIMGSAGGVGCNFLAVRRCNAYTNTIYHELGHCFFLLHTFEPDPTEKGLSLQYGDKICDLIKSDPVVANKLDSCFVSNDIGIFSKSEVSDYICNIMSYSYTTCRKCISKVQIARMRFYIHESPAMRMSLKSPHELQ